MDSHSCQYVSSNTHNSVEDQLLWLQQQLRTYHIPCVIVIEGFVASGKGIIAGELLEGLDPRGYQVIDQNQLSKDHDLYPALRRYWMHMPEKGKMSLFIGSWYQQVCEQCIKQKDPSKALLPILEPINEMEEMLYADGVLILKFFLQISPEEQKLRLKELKRKKLARMLFTKENTTECKQYDKHLALYRQMMDKTQSSYAPWYVLQSDDKQSCKQAIYEILIDAMQKAVLLRVQKQTPWDMPILPNVPRSFTLHTSPLSAYEPSQPPVEDYKSKLKAMQKKLGKLQFDLFEKDISMVLCFEGWDAAGKGGTIRRLSQSFDPRGFRVIPSASPTAEEKAHHHLWRYWNALPQKGHIALFDRTWYGRVMVERIEGFCSKEQWQRAYEEINLFEQSLVDHRTIVIKFWMQIDQAEQLKRFTARQNNPQKQWKITDEDWRNREKWAEYETSVNEMIQKTSTADAPWIVVEGNNKQYARLKVLQTVIDTMEEYFSQNEGGLS